MVKKGKLRVKNCLEARSTKETAFATGTSKKQRAMMRSPAFRHLAVLALLLVCAVSVALAANQRLYLTDGSFHLVREYQVLKDRVRFYSVERSAWEEIPLDLIDLKKTRSVNQSVEDDQMRERKMIDAEDVVERRLRNEAQGIPPEAGVYLYEQGKLRTFPITELEVVTDRKRAILKAINPLPLTAGKNYVEVKGPRSANVISVSRPEFYMRLHRQQMFGFVKLTPHKGNRTVQVWEIIPISKQVMEFQENVEDFRREAGPMLYQVWPREALEPGEYALITYSPGESNVRAWDFGYYPSAAPPATIDSKRAP